MNWIDFLDDYDDDDDKDGFDDIVRQVYYYFV